MRLRRCIWLRLVFSFLAAKPNTLLEYDCVHLSSGLATSIGSVPKSTLYVSGVVGGSILFALVIIFKKKDMTL